MSDNYIVKNLYMKDLKDEIVKLGWQLQDDRGMSENYGHQFEKDGYTLRYWKPHPRFNISHNEHILYDTGIVDEEVIIPLLEIATEQYTT